VSDVKKGKRYQGPASGYGLTKKKDVYIYKGKEQRQNKKKKGYQKKKKKKGMVHLINGIHLI